MAHRAQRHVAAFRFDLHRRFCFGGSGLARRTPRDDALEWAGELQQSYPKVIVDPEPIYVQDGNCWTSAGVTAGIDLCLALVEQDLGREVALAVAQMMVVFVRRPAGQAQFSATLSAQGGLGETLGDLLAWFRDNIRRPLSVAELARRTAMSPRNFARQFRREGGKTPGRHLEDLRIEAARRQLESTSSSLGEIAASSGFASAEVLRRVLRRRLGVTPSQYRASFGKPEPHRPAT